MANDIRQDEEQRQCPICRMVISAWATKCRYCGEEVGRPKREEQKVTIQDLGGEQSTTYTLSGNVKDALEAFRAEQQMAMEVQRRKDEEKGSWFHRKGHDEDAPQDAVPDSFSKLDARHKDLAQSVLADVYTPKPTKTTRRGGLPEPLEQALKITGIAVATIVVLIALVMGGGKLLAYLKADDTPQRVLMDNQAEIMLSRGEPLIEAFEESVRVANFNETESDRETMESIRGKLVDQIRGFLDAEPYDSANLRKAASLVERAILVDPSSVFRNLKGTVDKEGKAYGMVLTDFQVEPPQATFRIHNDAYRDEDGNPVRSQTAGLYELVQNRFIVQKIDRNQGVVLSDRNRAGRMVVFPRKGSDARAYSGSLTDGQS